jgi:hypothetical protein
LQQLRIGAAPGSSERSSERLDDAADNLRRAQLFKGKLYGVGALLRRWRVRAAGALRGESEQRRWADT